MAPVGTHLLTYSGHRTVVQALAWSSDGARLASGGGTTGWTRTSPDFSVQIWEASTGQQLLTYLGHAQSVLALAWSPDDARIASASADHTVQVWDATTGAELLTYRGHTKYVRAVAWSPDGTRLASASLDQTVQVWDSATGALLLTYTGHAHPVQSLSWSPDGQRIASGGGYLPMLVMNYPIASRDFGIHVWEATSGQRLLVYQGHTALVHALAWAPGGGSSHAHASPHADYVASTGLDKTLQIWNAVTGQQVHTCSGDLGQGYAVAWSPDGAYLASGGDSTGWVNRQHHYTVHIWEVSTGQQIASYHGHKDNVFALAWSPDGTRIASASEDTTVQIWAART